MRFLVSLLVVFVMVGTARAESSRWRIQRVLEVSDELKLDEQRTGKLFAVLAAYERERDKLHADLAEILTKLATTSDPAAADRLLDDSLAKQRALVAAEQRLVGKIRGMLPAKLAARARMMLLSPYAATSVRGSDPATEPPGNSDDLFPPSAAGSTTPPVNAAPAGTRPCDPFSTMHGCPF